MSKASLNQVIINRLPKPIVEMLISLKYAGRRFPGYKLYEAYVKDMKGIEIGGPSAVFKGRLPIYYKVGNLDGVNFSNNTVWEGSIQSGSNFNYIGSKKGTQYILEATDLAQIESNAYDFVLSSNCLEHIANPLKALFEWVRIMRDGGAMILVLPNKISNFDHKRPFTTFEHILDDFNAAVAEHDLTHLDEILALHDLSLDPAAGNMESFKSRCLDNSSNRTLHHHVFGVELISAMLDYAGLDVIDVAETKTDLFALAVKGH